MRWLVDHRWWALVGTFVLLLLGLVLSSLVLPRPLVSTLPGVVVLVLFLLFFASLKALVGGRRSPRPPGPN